MQFSVGYCLWWSSDQLGQCRKFNIQSGARRRPDQAVMSKPQSDVVTVMIQNYELSHGNRSRNRLQMITQESDVVRNDESLVMCKRRESLEE